MCQANYLKKFRRKFSGAGVFPIGGFRGVRLGGENAALSFLATGTGGFYLLEAMDKSDNPQEPLTKTLSKSGIFDPILPHIAALDAFLEELVEAFSPVTRPLVRYTFSHRGKRLRPALVFLSGWRDGSVDSRLVRAAAIVELIHLATLVHDDVLDDAQLRHASPTLFAKYGSHTAVLLGDAILSHALSLMAEFDSADLCRAMAIATRKICDGEIWQTSERGNATLSVDDYFHIIQMKTGELFEISAYLGAMLAGYGAERGSACAVFGRSLGRAYQIFDDLVDFLGSEAAIGKTLGTDLASGKYTLPMILFLQKKSDGERAKIVGEIAAGTLSLEALSAAMKADNIFEECREFFRKEVETAKDALAAFGEEFGATQLGALAEFVVSRVDKFFAKNV